MERATTTLLTMVLALVLAACGGDPATSADDTAGATEPAATEPAATEPAATESAATEPAATGSTAATASADGDAATVAVAETDLGEVLVDGDGMTLYVFDADDVDTSTCTGDCLQAWPAVVATEASAGDGVTGELATFTRDDGDDQVSIGGRPLYRYAQDSAPGDTTGQGVGDAWWVVAPDGTAITGDGGGDGGGDGSSESGATESGVSYGGPAT